MKRISFAAAALAALLLCTPALADEGMWMVNALSRALVQNMENAGLQMGAGEIYDAEAVSLKDAIVSLDFGCTGSMVSRRGLLITNHHCAYADVHALSTPECNYLEDGFVAAAEEDEIYIPGKSAYFLQRVIDVTDEVNALTDSLKAAGAPFGSRKISHLMETRYTARTGLDASLSSMWAGSHYYMALYRVYTDIRLVAAPPVSIAAFGGDVDNWEWPQHKCDFALYRIYAAPDGSPAVHSASNVPWTPSRWLQVSTAGYDEGDFTMIMGYPGRTDRYASSAKIDYLTTLSLPITNKVREDQMKIMMRWMNADPQVRLKYADRYFSLSNVQELQQGEVDCCKRFKVKGARSRMERKYLRGGANRRLRRDLSDKYRAIRGAEKNIIWYRETLVRGTRLALVASRLKNSRDFDYETEYSTLDLRLERDLFRYSLEAYYEHVDSVMWGPYQTQVRDMFYDSYAKTCDYDRLCGYLWTDDWITKEDPLYRFFTDVQIKDFNSAVDKAAGEVGVAELGRRYTRALYKAREAKGEPQYPDANSTMRLTYGRVGSYERDGSVLPVFTTSAEILSKEDTTQYDFTLKPCWRSLLQTYRDEQVNFLTDNDITGGNSGSPVLDARGRIIGLAFDGNKESLASDVAWTEGYNKCVCVDIRFVLFAIEKYMRLNRVLEEMEIVES